MVGPIKDRPAADGEGGSRRIITRKRAAIAASVLAAVVIAGGGGYLAGERSGADVDAARVEGEKMGWTRGTTIGGDIYPAGLEQGRKITYARTFRASYREAYLKAFAGTDVDVPKADEIKVSVP